MFKPITNAYTKQYLLRTLADRKEDSKLWELLTTYADEITDKEAHKNHMQLCTKLYFAITRHCIKKNVPAEELDKISCLVLTTFDMDQLMDIKNLGKVQLAFILDLRERLKQKEKKPTFKYIYVPVTDEEKHFLEEEAKKRAYPKTGEYIRLIIGSKYGERWLTLN